MSQVQELITKHIDIWTAAETEKRSGRGRASGNANSVYGIKKLRELILELAVRGKLVPQDANDEPASELLKHIQAEKDRLIVEGLIRKEKSLPCIQEMEIPYSLPATWEWVRFGSIAQHNSGKTLDNGRNTGTLHDYITTSNLYWGRFELENVRQMPIREEEFEKCSAKKGDLLICEGGEAGRAAVWFYEKEICFQNHVHRARFYCDIDPYFGYRFFEKLNATGEINQHRKGVAISNMSGKALSEIYFPLPPLKEQNRIVAKVDELMALCDQLEAQHNNAAEAHEQLVSHLLGTLTQSQDAADFNTNWQRIATHFDTLFTTESSIDTLKQTLLQLAVMGKLVPQDPKDEPASELLKRIRAEKTRLVAEGQLKKEKPLVTIDEDEKSFNLPKGWEWSVLGQLVLKVSDGPHFSPKYVEKENGIPFISARNIRTDGWELESAKYVSFMDHEEFTKRTKAKFGDILYTKGGTTGVAKVNDLDFEFSVWVHIAVLNLLQTEVYNHYLCLALNSPHCYLQSQKFTHGSSNKDLGLTRMINITVPLPPLPEQKSIVAKARELNAICDKLKSRLANIGQYQQKMADILVKQGLSRALQNSI